MTSMLPSTTAAPLPPNFFEICWRILVSMASREASATIRSTCPQTAPIKAMPIIRVSSSGVGRVPLCDREAVKHEELDLLVLDGLARPLGKPAPYIDRRQVRLHHEGAALDQSLKRVGMAEHLVVGGDHDLDVLKLGIGDLHRLGTERDVIVGRRTALLGAIFRAALECRSSTPARMSVRSLPVAMVP